MMGILRRKLQEQRHGRREKGGRTLRIRCSPSRSYLVGVTGVGGEVVRDGDAVCQGSRPALSSNPSLIPGVIHGTLAGLGDKDACSEGTQTIP